MKGCEDVLFRSPQDSFGETVSRILSPGEPCPDDPRAAIVREKREARVRIIPVEQLPHVPKTESEIRVSIVQSAFLDSRFEPGRRARKDLGITDGAERTRGALAEPGLCLHESEGEVGLHILHHRGPMDRAGKISQIACG